MKEIQELRTKNSLLQMELKNANKHIEYLTSLIPNQNLKRFGDAIIMNA